MSLLARMKAPDAATVRRSTKARGFAAASTGIAVAPKSTVSWQPRLCCAEAGHERLPRSRPGRLAPGSSANPRAPHGRANSRSRPRPRSHGRKHCTARSYRPASHSPAAPSSSCCNAGNRAGRCGSAQAGLQLFGRFGGWHYARWSRRVKDASKALRRSGRPRHFCGFGLQRGFVLSTRHHHAAADHVPQGGVAGVGPRLQP